MTKNTRWLWLCHAVVWTLGAWCIFRLPWLLPPSRPVMSDSYVVGFNNHVSTLAVGTIIVVSCFLYVLSSHNQTQQNMRARLTRLFVPTSSHGARASEYLMPFGFAALQAIALCLWYRALPNRYFGEITYPFSRTELVLLGEVPFRDFQWNYGPFLLYLPAAIVRLSNYGIDLDTAYVCGLIVTSTLGFVGAYFVIAQLRTTKWQRVALFLLLCISFNIGLGAQHTYLRFLMPFVALFLFHRAVEKQGGATSRSSRVGLCVWATVLCLLCFAVSPDNGVAFYAGLLFYCIGQFKAGARWFALCAVSSLAATGALISLFSSHYFHSLLSFGGGFGNFPLYLTPHVIFYLASLFALVPFLGACGWKNTQPYMALQQRNVGALMAALCASAALLSAAALGRCDANHIFTNGLIVFLLALAALWRRRFGALYVGTFFLVFTLGANYFLWSLYKPIVDLQLADKRAGQTKFDRHFFASDFEKRHPDLLATKQRAAPLKSIGTPLGVEEDMEVFLRYSGLFIPEYHAEPFPHVFNEKQLQDKLRGVAKMPYILVATDVLNRPTPDWNDARALKAYEEAQGYLINRIFVIPVRFELRNKPFIPEYNVRDFIKARFKKISDIGPYSLMENNRPVS